MLKDELLDKWQNYKTSAEEKSERILKFKYKKYQAEKATLIAEALIFWKFILKLLPWDYTNTAPVAWMKRQESLAVFSDNLNPLIRLIVRIEALPTVVWRKILWKHNIDFMSFESFLRRISESQMAAFEDNYYDLHISHNVPRVFSWWDRFCGKVSVEKIFAECYEYAKRYCNKGAMSYNLLGLDFGFNAYPKGTNDDEKVIEISPLKFLSIKNHADDFVVNQEAGGKYWGLYKSARSNYVWRPNKKIELKTHICPGFWYTIFAHLFFWTVSPAMMVSLIALFIFKPITAISVGAVVALGIPGLVTPLWAFIASAKFIINSEGFEWLKEFPDKHENIFGTILGSILVAFAVSVLYVAGLVLLGIYLLLSPGFGMVWSILIMIAALVYIGYKIYYRTRPNRYRLPEFEEYPTYFMIPLLAFAEALLVKFALVYPNALNQIIAFIFRTIAKGLGMVANFCLKLWEYFLMLGSMGIVIVLYAVFTGLIWYIMTLDKKKQEKLFGYLEKVMLYVSYAAWAAVFVLFFIPLRSLLTLHSQEFYFAFAFISAVIFTCQKVAAWSMNPVVKESKEVAKCANKWIAYKVGIGRRLILQNAWLKTLDRQAKEDVLYFAIEKVVDRIFVGEWITKALEALVPTMTREILDAIDEKRGMILGYSSSEQRLRIFKKMAIGHNFEEAVALAEAERIKDDLLSKKRAKQWKTTKAVLKVVFFPLVFIWWVVNLIFKAASKLGELAATFYRLYELFNKRCPYVTQKRVLRMD